MGTLRDPSTSPLCFPERGPSHLITRHSLAKSRFWKEGGTAALAESGGSINAHQIKRLTLGRLRQEDCEFEVDQDSMERYCLRDKDKNRHMNQSQKERTESWDLQGEVLVFLGWRLNFLSCYLSAM